MIDLLQVVMKRGRSQLEQLDHDEAGEPRKKLRLGTPTCQWITVYNAHVPMKQRCGALTCHCCPDDSVLHIVPYLARKVCASQPKRYVAPC